MKTKQIRIPKALKAQWLKLDQGMLASADHQDVVNILAKLATDLESNYGRPCADHGGCMGCRVWAGFYALANAMVP